MVGGLCKNRDQFHQLIAPKNLANCCERSDADTIVPDTNPTDFVYMADVDQRAAELLFPRFGL